MLKMDHMEKQKNLNKGHLFIINIFASLRSHPFGSRTFLASLTHPSFSELSPPTPTPTPTLTLIPIHSLSILVFHLSLMILSSCCLITASAPTHPTVSLLSPRSDSSIHHNLNFDHPNTIMHMDIPGKQQDTTTHGDEFHTQVKLVARRKTLGAGGRGGDDGIRNDDAGAEGDPSNEVDDHDPQDTDSNIFRSSPVMERHPGFTLKFFSSYSSHSTSSPSTSDFQLLQQQQQQQQVQGNYVWITDGQGVSSDFTNCAPDTFQPHASEAVCYYVSTFQDLQLFEISGWQGKDTKPHAYSNSNSDSDSAMPAIRVQAYSPHVNIPNNQNNKKINQDQGVPAIKVQVIELDDTKTTGSDQIHDQNYGQPHRFSVAYQCPSSVTADSASPASWAEYNAIHQSSSESDGLFSSSGALNDDKEPKWGLNDHNQPTNRLPIEYLISITVMLSANKEDHLTVFWVKKCAFPGTIHPYINLYHLGDQADASSSSTFDVLGQMIPGPPKLVYPQQLSTRLVITALPKNLQPHPQTVIQRYGAPRLTSSEAGVDASIRGATVSGWIVTEDVVSYQELNQDAHSIPGHDIVLITVLYDCYHKQTSFIEFELEIPPFRPVIASWTKDCGEGGPNGLSISTRAFFKHDVVFEGAATFEYSPPITASTTGSNYASYPSASKHESFLENIAVFEHNVSYLDLYLSNSNSKPAIDFGHIAVTVENPQILFAQIVVPSLQSLFYFSDKGGILGPGKTAKLRLAMICKNQGSSMIYVTMPTRYYKGSEFGFRKICRTPRKRQQSGFLVTASSLLYMVLLIFILTIAVFLSMSMKKFHSNNMRPQTTVTATMTTAIPNLPQSPSAHLL